MITKLSKEIMKLRKKKLIESEYMKILGITKNVIDNNYSLL